MATAKIERARHLHQTATDAERKLWQLLRTRTLAGAKFRRQHPVPLPLRGRGVLVRIFPPAQEIKVFCFFSSEKKIFLIFQIGLQTGSVSSA
jgi:hypothetical protein